MILLGADTRGPLPRRPRWGWTDHIRVGAVVDVEQVPCGASKQHRLAAFEAWLSNSQVSAMRCEASACAGTSSTTQAGSGALRL